jgi:hypothetical protein
LKFSLRSSVALSLVAAYFVLFLVFEGHGFANQLPAIGMMLIVGLDQMLTERGRYRKHSGYLARRFNNTYACLAMISTTLFFFGGVTNLVIQASHDFLAVRVYAVMSAFVMWLFLHFVQLAFDNAGRSAK